MPVTEHPLFTLSQGPDQPIWRYMDFTKLVSILQRQALFFCRADLLGDPFEGSWTEGALAQHEALLAGMANSFAFKEAEPHEVKDMIAENRKRIQEYRKSTRESSKVLCWHSNTYESAAMWKLYARTNEAVAIRSTLSSLRESLRDAPHRIYIGEVKYIDYKSGLMDHGNLLTPLIHKRMSFAHENEIRAVIADMAPYNADPGVYVDADIKTLMREVYVAPDCPSWFSELVEGVLRKYNLDCPVVRSSLADSPLF